MEEMYVGYEMAGRKQLEVWTKWLESGKSTCGMHG